MTRKAEWARLDAASARAIVSVSVRKYAGSGFKKGYSMLHSVASSLKSPETKFAKAQAGKSPRHLACQPLLNQRKPHSSAGTLVFACNRTVRCTHYKNSRRKNFQVVLARCSRCKRTRLLSPLGIAYFRSLGTSSSGTAPANTASGVPDALYRQ
jgi:hypothetical protein